jgi:hydroxyethylthiazole kinase-like uncharacterized protein yjeF
MQNIFQEVNTLDKRCYEEFALTEDLLMEHAAEGMAVFIRKNFKKNAKIIIVVGSGNNGADGIALGRLLHKEFSISLFVAKEASSPMALLQNKRASLLQVPHITQLEECDILVDAFVGTGFKGEFSSHISKLFKEMNASKAYKIACDIPSGLRSDGTIAKNTFCADTSLTMGALKRSLFLDEAKDVVGNIKVLDLGVSRKIYEGETAWKLLEFSDMQLPHRIEKNTHKGSFGHLALLSGEKTGASTLSALSALRFGTGLVTLVTKAQTKLPTSLMQAKKIPNNASALACGMGLGKTNEKKLQSFLDNSLPLVVDADMFHMSSITQVLQRNSLVITPHPKEFVALLKRTQLANISVKKLQKNRFKYVELFCKAYPNLVLLLKGANVIIGQGKEFFINPYGDAKLAKGGSGDVLSGLIAALLAQGYVTLDASITASLAHTKLAQNYTGADFSLTPDDLIEGIGNL